MWSWLQVLDGWLRRFDALWLTEEKPFHTVLSLPSDCLPEGSSWDGSFVSGQLIELCGSEKLLQEQLCKVVNEAIYQEINVLYICFDPDALWSSFAQVECFEKSSHLCIFVPKSAENTIDLLVHVLKEGAFDLVVLDSIPRLIPGVELESNWGRSGLCWERSRWLNSSFRRVAGGLRESSSALLFLHPWIGASKQQRHCKRIEYGGYTLRYLTTTQVDFWEKNNK